MKSATLFSGGEGAGLGMVAAGFTHAWGVEYDDKIAQVARDNGFNVLTADILQCDPSDFEPVDWLHASPPCPNFSNAKTNAEETDNDRALAAKVCEFITELLPRFLTIENVYQYRNSQSWETIARTLLFHGYSLNYWHVCMADYGVPQTRRRMIAIARRDGKRPSLPPATHDEKPQVQLFGAKRPWVSWYEAIEDLIPTLPDSEFAPWQLSRLPNEFKEMIVCDKESWYNTGNKGANYHGKNQEVIACKVLSELQARVGKKALLQWGNGVMAGFQPSKILQQALHGSSIQTDSTGGKTEQGQYALLFSEICDRWGLRDMRKSECNRCSSQGRGLDEQLGREFAAYLSELSHENPQSEKDLQNRWLRRNQEGERLLQQTLSSFQKIWESTILEDTNSNTQKDTGSFIIGNTWKDTIIPTNDGTPMSTVVTENAGGLPRAFIMDAANPNSNGQIKHRWEDEPVRTMTASDMTIRAFVDGQQAAPDGNGGRKLTIRENEPAVTISASQHKSPHTATVNVRVVKMTPRALARFQSFPDSYQLPGDGDDIYMLPITKSAALACRIIGNAVPPLFMQRLGEWLQ